VLVFTSDPLIFLSSLLFELPCVVFIYGWLFLINIIKIIFKYFSFSFSFEKNPKDNDNSIVNILCREKPDLSLYAEP